MKNSRNECQNCGHELRACGKCGWSKVYEEDMSDFKTENARLREVLEWYASFWNHDVQLEDVGITSMQKDRGERARLALDDVSK